MSESRSFDENKKVGEPAETKIMDLFDKNHVRYVDVRDEQFWREKDVDFIAIINDQIVLIDAKGDTQWNPNQYKSNVVYQVVTDEHLGAAEYSKSEYFFYYSNITGDYIWINVLAWREYFHNHKCKIQPMKTGHKGQGQGTLFEYDFMLCSGIATKQYKSITNPDYLNGSVEFKDYIVSQYINTGRL